MSAEEYLIWEPTQEQRYEYWDGEIVVMSGSGRNHNRVSGNFFKILDDSFLMNEFIGEEELQTLNRLIRYIVKGRIQVVNQLSNDGYLGLWSANLS